MKYVVTVRGFDRVSTQRYDAVDEEEAKQKALEANHITVEVTPAVDIEAQIQAAREDGEA